MKTILKSRQNGFAIIEALIAFLLLGIGVAALVSLQGNLMSGSSTSKARAEAMELAKDRTEMLRNIIDREQYLSALGSVPQGDTVDGINATYTVNYTITNPLTTDKTQHLTVKVSWTGSESDSEEVSLETMLYYMSPTIASGIESVDGDEGDFFPLVSPLITGVEGEHPSTAQIIDSQSEGYDGDDISDDSPGVEIRRYTAAVGGTLEGRSNIEVLYDTDGDGDKEVVLTSFGGIVHKLQGDVTIDSRANTTLDSLSDNLRFLASPPSFCVFPINPLDVDGDGDNDFASYVCYVPGDCTYGVADGYVVSTPPDFSNPGCPANFLPPNTGIPDLHDLNGGWYGRVGNFGIAIHPEDMVCTSQTTRTHLTPSREYVTYRYEDSSKTTIIGNEGINTPYSNQIFLIIRNDTDCSDYSVALVDEQIKRELVGAKEFNSVTGAPTGSWQQNTVLPEVPCDQTVSGVDSSCPPPP
jgi:type IV pilus assembly protein PilV